MVVPPHIASFGDESCVTKVTWFSRGSGSLGVLQSSTVPLTLRGCVDERGSDPDDPPVSRTMFKEASEERKK